MFSWWRPTQENGETKSRKSETTIVIIRKRGVTDKKLLGEVPKCVFLRQEVGGGGSWVCFLKTRSCWGGSRVHFPKSVFSSGKGHAIGVLEPQENPWELLCTNMVSLFPSSLGPQEHLKIGRSPLGIHPGVHLLGEIPYRNQRCITPVALPFTLKSILMQKKNYENSNISPCKNIIFKNPLKEKKNLQDIITLLVWRVPLAQVLPRPQLIFPFKIWCFRIYLNFQQQKSLQNRYLPHSESKSYQINSIKSSHQDLSNNTKGTFHFL